MSVDPNSPLTAAQSLARLLEGNKKFYTEHYDVRPTLGTIRSLQAGQRPYAAIISCADSRVAPNEIFNCDLGEIFVVRTAGNVVSDYELGSIEYAVEHLGTPLVMVLGHKNCGAVAGAYEWAGGHGALAKLMDEVSPSITRAKRTASNKADVISLAEIYNIENSINRLMESPLIASLPQGSVVAAEYDVATGIVKILS